jgi:thiol-disulfide isomerase/thioredoxin
MLLFSACGAQNSPAPAPSRVVSVAATDEPSLARGFCDVHPTGAEAPAFSLPPLDGGPMSDDPGWTWVSFWATWCAPCIAEMPLMRQWMERLGQEGQPVALRYVSVDASAEDLARFRATHKGAPDGHRLARQESLAAWLPTLGLDPAGSVPLHVFVDPENRVRCARQGAISSSDYGAIKAVLKGR